MDKHREIKITRSLLLDAMLFGVAIAKQGDSEKVLEGIKPQQMTSATGRLLMGAVVDRDRPRLEKLMRTRFGVTFEENEMAVSAIIRTVQLRSASEAVRNMTRIMLESVTDEDSLGNTLETWEEAIELLRKVVAIEEGKG